jgi:toxin ParE1/3/4
MKHYDVLLTPDAITDLQEIYDYVADESGSYEVAWSYMQKLQKRCEELLSIAPLRGQARDDLRVGLRIIALNKQAVAAFEVHQYHVLVLNIFHGGEDYEALMW